VVVNFHLNGCAVWLYRVLERGQAVGDGVDIGEVVGREHFPLDDGEVDLYLIQPGRVHRGVHHDRVGVLLGESVDRGLSAMGGPVVHDPKHPIG
jgi:hypothetical protein